MRWPVKPQVAVRFRLSPLILKIMDEDKKVLFQITPEHRFKNALHALDDLDCDYEIMFQGVKYVRHVDRTYIGHNSQYKV